MDNETNGATRLAEGHVLVKGLTAERRLIEARDAYETALVKLAGLQATAHQVSLQVHAVRLTLAGLKDKYEAALIEAHRGA